MSVSRFFGKVATSIQTAMRRISTDDLEPPLDLSDDNQRIIIRKLKNVPAAPTGGATVDVEAREWIADFLECLRRGGLR